MCRRTSALMKGIGQFAILVCATAVLTFDSSQATRPVETYSTGEFIRGGCEIRGLYPYDLTSFDTSEITRWYRLGEQWSDRCSNCTCTTSGVSCRGPRCEHAYDFTQEEWCLEWSEDGCCCERMGCEVDGRQYSIGERFPFGRGNPCLTCLCEIGWSRANCLMQGCGVHELTCSGRLVTYNGCCPTYFCPLGTRCTTIPDPYPNTPQHELLDWYGGQLEPIPMGHSQFYHLDTFNTYKCTCLSGGTATCEMQSFGKK